MQVVETAGVGAVAGREIANDVAVHALSMVIAIKMWRKRTNDWMLAPFSRYYLNL